MPAFRRWRAVPVIVLGLLVAWCGAPGDAESSSAVLRLAWWTDVGFPTPFSFSTVGPGGVVRLTLIYDTLTWKDARGQIPWLATSWRISPDGRTYLFDLRPGVRWHDGSPLSAEDIKFSFDYYRRHPFRWVSVAHVAGVAVQDPRTVSITLDAPFAPFLTEIAGIVPIVPEHIWRDNADPTRAQDLHAATGSGPFRLRAYNPAAGEYVLEANPDYFKGPPAFRQVRYQVLPAEQQLLAIQQGHIDVALTTDYSAAEALRRRPPLGVLQTEPLSVARLVFNTRRPPLNDRRFRQAIAFALPRRQIATLVTHGPALLGGPGIVPPGTAWYDPAVKQYPHNLVEASALLDQLGFRPAADGIRRTAAGVPLRIELLTDPADPEAPLIRQALRAAGLEVSLVPADPKTRGALAREGRFQMLLTSHIGVGGDPDFLRLWYTGQAANTFAQGDFLENDEFLGLAAQQVATLDPLRRRQQIFRMQEILAEEVPTLPLYYRPFYWVYDSGKLHPFETLGGLMDGIPLIENKLILLQRRAGP